MIITFKIKINTLNLVPCQNLTNSAGSMDQTKRIKVLVIQFISILS